MKLYISETSPYARKCRVLLREKGLSARIEEVVAHPFDNGAELLENNPLGKVPALTREGATTLVNSPLICDFIDAQSDPRWIPKSGPARWRVLRFEALADGVIDLTVARRVELTKPDADPSKFWLERQENGVRRALDQLESEADKFGGAVDLGAVAIAVALGYLDFRYPESDWRTGRPGLTALFDRWSERPSFQETAPPSAA